MWTQTHSRKNSEFLKLQSTFNIMFFSAIQSDGGMFMYLTG